MKKVLIGSPIKRDPEILNAFLKGLDYINTKGVSIEYCFVDDNDCEKSKELIKKFAKNHPKTTVLEAKSILSSHNIAEPKYNGPHDWNDNLIARIAITKDEIIQFAKKGEFDYLFFIDSDMILQPETLHHLISRKVDIVSEIFWTDWHHDGTATPSIWLEDENTLVPKSCLVGQNKYYEKREIRSLNAKLKVPGIYEVGGLGALTLISKKAIMKGVSFAKIKNLSFFGEDRDFCVRASALGLKLYVDTVYPAFHIFRKTLLKNIELFRKNGYRVEYVTHHGKDPNIKKKTCVERLKDLRRKAGAQKRDLLSLKNAVLRRAFAKKRVISKEHKVTLMLMVRNEGDRFLREMLESVKPIIDEAVILDDASSDDTVKIIKEILSNKKILLLQNKQSGFSKEYKNRKKLWKATVSTKPDWILALDADEILDPAAADIFPALLDNPSVDAFGFYWYNMWDKIHYRLDDLWKVNPQIALIRFQPKFHYRFNHKKQHCGRFPSNVYDLYDYCNFPLKIKHLGWMRDEDKKNKYQRYIKLDPKGKYNSLAQYESILDKAPNLIKYDDKQKLF